MAPPVKADLRVTHDRLQTLARYLLETAARLQVAGATTAVIDLASLQDQGRSLMQSVMDLEGYLP